MNTAKDKGKTSARGYHATTYLALVGWLVRHAPIMAAAGDRLHPVHCAQAQVAHCSVLVTLGQ